MMVVYVHASALSADHFSRDWCQFPICSVSASFLWYGPLSEGGSYFVIISGHVTAC